jgi:hypothetical protein
MPEQLFKRPTIRWPSSSPTDFSADVERFLAQVLGSPVAESADADKTQAAENSTVDASTTEQLAEAYVTELAAQALMNNASHVSLNSAWEQNLISGTDVWNNWTLVDIPSAGPLNDIQRWKSASSYRPIEVADDAATSWQLASIPVADDQPIHIENTFNRVEYLTNVSEPQFVRVVESTALRGPVSLMLTTGGATLRIALEGIDGLTLEEGDETSVDPFPLFAAAMREGRVIGRGMPSPGERKLRYFEADPDPADEAEQIGFGRSGAWPADAPRRPHRR